jgi:hypothetical protein
MSKQLFNLLDDSVKKRDWLDGQKAMTEMAQIYEGELPRQYEKFFPKNSPKQMVQVIPLAWDDLATQVGRLPDLRGEPRDQTRAELKRVGLHEKIGFSYLRDALPTGKRFMRDLAWWLQVGRAVAIVTPDFEKQKPRLELRDPRTCYPGVAKRVNNTIVSLDDIIFKYKLPIDEARLRNLAPPPERGNWPNPEKSEVEVLEYLDDKTWMIVSEFGNMVRGEHNLGLVPAHVFESFTPDGPAGKSRFKDQIALMVSIARLISAKIAFADRLVNPILWAKGSTGTLELGPYVINNLGPNGEMGQIAPPTQFQVDRDIQLLNQFSRVLNRNPEVRQGEIASKGVYTSAKTLEQLAEAIDTVVGADWDIIAPGLEYLMKVCFTMDVKLWPNTQKTINGSLRGKRFLDSYTPKDDIGDRVDIRVDYGFGVGGYQGFLMHLQAKEAKTMSRRRAMEAMPGVTDVDEEMNLIDVEDMDEAGKAMFQNLAAQGMLDMPLWAELRKEMAEKGTPLYEAIIKYQSQIQEQAAAAAESEQQGGLAAPEQGPPQEEALPGIPPAVLAGV